jgi:hypothetical protein
MLTNANCIYIELNSLAAGYLWMSCLLHRSPGGGLCQRQWRENMTRQRELLQGGRHELPYWCSYVCPRLRSRMTSLNLRSIRLEMANCVGACDTKHLCYSVDSPPGCGFGPAWLALGRAWSRAPYVVVPDRPLPRPLPLKANFFQFFSLVLCPEYFILT